MLYAFGFERIGVVVSDLYFIDPDPEAGQEGAEHGVRLELRMLQDGALKGSIYSARPISIDRPLWRVDLLESVDGPTGSMNRTHHHPRFDGWEPGRRVFVKELSADPLKWVGQRLSDLPGVLADAGVAEEEVAPTDAERLREAAPRILEVLDRLLNGVWSGELGQPPHNEDKLTEARVSWL
ncbi:hypothetical protein [Streptomyces silvisoli]|uniref:Uncharacterized protein n=1 Tax=Streptomyces silvisoli TaxID=3034235 RepID=A0ABT5ZIV3_9ACTN|nr:hypothetical protein [Streptomyces silvisoli]MDF3289745.1 hypothetical protein [Streptomyces silvisoli]